MKGKKKTWCQTGGAASVTIHQDLQTARTKWTFMGLYGCLFFLAVGGTGAGVRLDAEDSCCSTVCMDDTYKLLRKGSKTAGTMVGRQQNELEAAK